MTSVEFCHIKLCQLRLNCVLIFIFNYFFSQQTFIIVSLLHLIQTLIFLYAFENNLQNFILCLLRSVLKLKLNISLILDANVSLLKHLKLTLIFYCWLHTFCEYLISTLYFMVCRMIWEIIFCTFILALNHSLPDQGFSTKLYQYLARQYSGAMEDVQNHSTTHERPKEENRKLPTNFKLVCGFKSVRKIMLQREFLKQRMLTSYSQKKQYGFRKGKSTVSAITELQGIMDMDLDQCFSTGGPQRSFGVPPKFPC